MSYHGGSSEEMEGSERLSRSRRIESGSRAFSTSAIHLSPAASLRSQQPGRPKGYTSDDHLYEQIPDNELGPAGLRECFYAAPRPNSLENSRNASASSSPLTLKGSSSFPPGRPDSMSSDDFVPTKEAATLPRDVYVSRPSPANKPEVSSNRNSLVSYNPERRPPSRAQPRPRSGSPGSEMVTLEEFLEESKQTSDASHGQDELLGDSSDLGGPMVRAAYRESTPNYVNLSAKLSGDAGDVKPGRPGQYVMPNLRPMDPAINQSASLKRPAATSKQVPEPQHPGPLAGRASSLSRAFSLATADLLKANGPDLNRMDKPELETPMLKDFSSHILRTSTPTGSPRDRPQPARMSNAPKSDDLRTRSLDTRRLSLAVSREDKTLQAALSTSSLQQPYTSAQTSGRGRPRPISRFGEVAMVSPVRPISSIPEVENQPGAVNLKLPSTPSDCLPPPTAEDDPNKTSPKSTPASPDPTDPHSVWYEYGCV